MKKREVKNDTHEVCKVDRCPSITLVISNSDGVLGVIGGESRGLATIMEQAGLLPDFPVTKISNNMLVTGQDCYQVSREFLMSIIGSFTFMSWSAIRDADRLLPSDAKIVIVVSY